MKEELRSGREFDGLVEKFWTVSGLGERGQDVFEVLPDGNFELVFILSDSFSKVFLAGPYTKRTLFPVCSPFEIFSVQFRPGKLPRLADVRPSDLVDDMVQVQRIFGSDACSIGERIHAAKGFDARRLLVEDLFRAGRLGPTVQEHLCNRATSIVESRGGQIKVAELADEAGVSIRTLERLFDAQVGISPKKFIRLVRFQDALSRLRASASRGGLAKLAYDCGYADQSHLIKEFKALSNALPGSI